MRGAKTEMLEQDQVENSHDLLVQVSFPVLSANSRGSVWSLFM